MVQSPNGLGFPPGSELGLTDINMTNGLEYDEEYDPERAFDMEYEVRPHKSPRSYENEIRSWLEMNHNSPENLHAIKAMIDCT